MDSNYGICVKNRFMLIIDDDDSGDPLEYLSSKDVEKTNASQANQSATKAKGQVSSAAKKSGAPVAPVTTASDKGSATKENKAKATQGSVANAAKATNKSTSSTTVTSNSNSDLNATTAAGQKRGNKPEQGGKAVGVDSTPSSQKNPRAGERNPNNRQRTDGPRPARPPQQLNQTNDGSSPGQREMEEKKNKRNMNRDTQRPPGQPGSYSYENEDRGRGRGNFRSRGRGGRGGGFDSRGKREYDRQSGSDKTGIKPMEKREGSGAHNWGSTADEIEAGISVGLEETSEMAERSGDETQVEVTKPEGEEAVVEGEDQAKLDEELLAKQMTLDEWKKAESNKRAVPTFNIRKAGEGEDNAQWKKTYVLKKKVESEDEDEYEEIEVEEEVRHGRQKKVLDIEINFTDDNRDMRRGRGRGGPRGGRGGDRGAGGDRRGGRGGDRGRGQGDREGIADQGERRRTGTFRSRGDPEKQAAPKVESYDDFPKLEAA